MPFSEIVNDLSLIKPEIVVSIGLVVIVLFDLIFSKSKHLLPYISILALIFTGYFLIDQFSLADFLFSSGSGKGLLTIDPFGTFFKLIIVLSSLFIITFSMLSTELDECKDRLGEYYTLIFGMIIGMFIMSSAADLIVIYLSVELLSLSSYVLAGFVKNSFRNSEASLKYLIYGAVSSGIMLFGISIIYGLTGSTNIYEINSLIQSAGFNTLPFILAGVLIFTGIGFKISVAPFHFWTPDVYEGAPIAITAYLSVASKAAGFALLIRFIKVTFIQTIDSAGYWQLVQIIDWQSFFILLSIITMTLGNFAALWQDNLKRMLAYSSIAHAGYLMLGLAVLSNQGLVAILIYFAVYLFMNLGAFLVVLLIANKTGSENIDDYRGLGYATPFLGISLAIFLVALTGIPPTAGFIGKLYLFIALIDANMFIVAFIALLNTVVSLYYYIRVLKNMYLVKVEKPVAELHTSPFAAVIIIILIIPVLLFGVYFTPLVDFATNSIALLGF